MAKPNVHSSANPCHLHPAPIAFGILHHYLLRRIVPSSSSVLVTSMLLLVSHVADGIPQRFAVLSSQLVLPLNRRLHELQKLCKRVSRQKIRVVQRTDNVFWSANKSSELWQNCVPPVGEFGSSFRKERRTLLMLVHFFRCFPDSGLVSALKGTLLRVLKRSAIRKGLPRKLHFFEKKS